MTPKAGLGSMLEVIARASLSGVLLGLASCVVSEAPGGDRPREDASAAADVAWADAGDLRPDPPDVAPPELAPCPPGWPALIDDRTSLEVCDPWPETTPIEWPCPSGWRVREVRGIDLCEPFPGVEPQVCGAHEAQFPGTAACVTVGSPCPSADFSPGLPQGFPIVFVRPGAVGGDGTRDRPHGSLSAVPFSDLQPGAIIALARGVHDDGPWSIDQTVTLWGACAGETVLRAPTGSASEAVVSVVAPGAQVTFRDLRIADSPTRGVEISDGARGILRGVIIDAATGYGLRAVGQAEVDLDTVIVRDTAPAPSGLRGIGIEVDGGRLSGRHVILSRNRDAALRAVGGGAAELTDSGIIETASPPARPNVGSGVVVEAGGEAQLERIVMERNRDASVYVGTGSRIEISDCIIRDTRAQGDTGEFGTGLTAAEGAAVVVRRCLFERNRDAGIYAEGTATELLVEDVAILETQSRQSNDDFGRGVELWAGARGTVRRVVLDRNRDAAIFVEDEGSTLELEDALVRETESLGPGAELAGFFGHGLEVRGGRASVRRAHFVGNRESSIIVERESGQLEASDLVIEQTRGRSLDAESPDRGELGRAISIQNEARATIRRLHAVRNRGTGILVSRGATLTLEDALIAETESTSRSGQFGRGFQAQRASVANLVRVRVDASRGFAVFASSTSAVTLEDVWASRTRSEACFEAGTCPGLADPAGGLGSSSESRFDANRVMVSNMGLCGLLMQSGGVIELRNALITDNPIGACVQSTDYDLSTISSRSVFYRDNEQVIESTDLPVADSTASDDGR